MPHHLLSPFVASADRYWASKGEQVAAVEKKPQDGTAWSKCLPSRLYQAVVVYTLCGFCKFWIHACISLYLCPNTSTVMYSWLCSPVSKSRYQILGVLGFTGVAEQTVNLTKNEKKNLVLCPMTKMTKKWLIFTIYLLLSGQLASSKHEFESKRVVTSVWVLPCSLVATISSVYRTTKGIQHTREDGSTYLCS